MICSESNHYKKQVYLFFGITLYESLRLRFPE